MPASFSEDGWLKAAPGGVTVRVLAVPKSSRERIEDVVQRPDGPALRVRIAAAPEDGKANTALVALLAKAWGLPARAVTLASGARGRHKTVFIEGDTAALLRRIAQWKDAHG